MTSFFEQLGEVFNTKPIGCIGIHCDTKEIAWSWGSRNRDAAVRSVKNRLGSSNCDIYTRTGEGFLAYASGLDVYGNTIIEVYSALYKRDAEQGAIDEAKARGAVKITETRVIHTDKGEC